MKKMIHVGCGGVVSNKTLVCKKCKRRPHGSKVELRKDGKTKDNRAVARYFNNIRLI